MREKMLTFIISKIVEMILGKLTLEQAKRELDKLIDYLEDLIEGTETTIDDTLMPALRFLRESLNIPDYPDEK